MPLWTPNTELSHADTAPILPDGTTRFLWQMVEKRHPDLRCSLRACCAPALLALQTPNGCVVERNDAWQAACIAHIVSDGFGTGAEAILDLTKGEVLSGGDYRSTSATLHSNCRSFCWHEAKTPGCQILPKPSDCIDE